MHQRILLRARKGPFDVVTAEETYERDWIGKNSGNLVFSHAAHKLLATSTAEITPSRFRADPRDADEINEKYDVFVIPLANAFRHDYANRLTSMARLIERLKIPVVVLGVGAQTDVDGGLESLRPIDEPVKAAEAYARAGDKEGEARALQAAGDVERLEFLLSTEQHKERSSRARDERTKDVDLMIECGKRRDALQALDELLASAPDDASLRERANTLRARRVLAPIVTLEASSTLDRPGREAEAREGKERYVLVTGSEVIIGRTEGAIKVPSNAVSRQHLRIARDGGSNVVVRDLESRNGTQLRGINLAGPLPVGEGIELKLGKEVPLRVTPSRRLVGAIEIDVSGARYYAYLGPTHTPVEGIELAAGSDGWIELVTRGARIFSGDVELVPRTTLLVGDTVSTTRGGEPLLRVIGT